jgi:hypothetical protein
MNLTGAHNDKCHHLCNVCARKINMQLLVVSGFEPQSWGLTEKLTDCARVLLQCSSAEKLPVNSSPNCDEVLEHNFRSLTVRDLRNGFLYIYFGSNVPQYDLMQPCGATPSWEEGRMWLFPLKLYAQLKIFLTSRKHCPGAHSLHVSVCVSCVSHSNWDGIADPASALGIGTLKAEQREHIFVRQRSVCSVNYRTREESLVPIWPLERSHK